MDTLPILTSCSSAQYDPLLILCLPFAYDMIHILPDPGSPVNTISTDKKGKVFVTTGPIIKLQMNDAEMGDILSVVRDVQVDLMAQVQCTQPLQFLEIIQNGDVIGLLDSELADVII